jgi:RES domain-containing protein
MTSHVLSAMTGEGAARYGGRWNSPGTRVVYSSGSLSLAMLEIMVHLDDYVTLVSSWSFLPLEIPSNLIITLERNPVGWNANPPGAASQRAGDAWAAGLKSAVLSVSSVLAPDERNYLLNPRHPDFAKIRVGKPQRLPFDHKLSKS